MNFRTQIPLQKQEEGLIDYHSKVVLIGSCFVEHIGSKLDYFKFQNGINPFGILFHSLAIEQFISNAITKKDYSENDVFFHNEQWHCFEAHSKLNNNSKEELLKRLNAEIIHTHKYLDDTTHIVLTLGTSWVYRFKETDKVVANCHKVPSNQFDKKLLSVSEIVGSLNRTVEQIRRINQTVKIIFTISPVRHIKDGFVENTQSKAHLISAVHQLLNSTFNIQNSTHSNLHYFPAYEIMFDELRDYRFYKEDMLHPNATAINYIWERFKTTWIDEAIFETMNQVDTIQKGLRHKPNNPNSEAHQKFLKDLEAKIKTVSKSYPFILFRT